MLWGKAAGWPNISVAEVMSFKKETTKEAIDAWLSTAYHREITLDGQYTSVGIGLQGGTAVMEPAFVKFQKKDPEVKVYLYEGMKGAGIGFYGREIPNPLDRFGVEYSGASSQLRQASTSIRSTPASRGFTRTRSLVLQRTER